MGAACKQCSESCALLVLIQQLQHRCTALQHGPSMSMPAQLLTYSRQPTCVPQILEGDA